MATTINPRQADSELKAEGRKAVHSSYRGEGVVKQWQRIQALVREYTPQVVEARTQQWQFRRETSAHEEWEWLFRTLQSLGGTAFKQQLESTLKEGAEPWDTKDITRMTRFIQLIRADSRLTAVEVKQSKTSNRLIVSLQGEVLYYLSPKTVYDAYAHSEVYRASTASLEQLHGFVRSSQKGINACILMHYIRACDLRKSAN